MTILSKRTAACFVCASEVTFSVAVSTNQIGAPDLDMRPPPMARSLVGLAVRECRACGYCAADIATGSPGAAALVHSDEYRRLRDDDAYPPLANAFLRQAFLLEAGGDLIAAGWAALMAAWCGDDARRRDAAVGCRVRALDLFLRGLADGQPMNGDTGSQRALLADIARRAELFHEAGILCRRGLAEQPGAVVTRLLAFQRRLADEEDPGGYTFLDLPK